MRKIITFLGRNPKEAEYKWNDETHKATVFPEVLQRKVEYDQMLVFVTDEAKREALPYLHPETDPRIVAVDIPTPKTEADYWVVFDCLTERVGEEDAVVFDITHGFRSIPFLVFLAAAYLKAAKGVDIEGIYYGALEMGQPAPVIDLSPFAGLLDWLAATNQFIRTGNAADLARVLKRGRPQGRSSVGRLADSLEGLSLALMLGYPLEAMRKAGEFKRALDDAGDDVQTLPAPFRVLLQRLRDEYAARALADPDSDVQRNLQIQLDLLDWYVTNGQIVQAMTLAREWVVSAVAWKSTGTLELDYREPWERAISGIAPLGKERAQVSAPADLRLSDAQMQAVRKLWSSLRNLRNDLAHAGMKRSPTKPTKIEKSARETAKEVRALAECLGICSPRESGAGAPEGAR